MPVYPYKGVSPEIAEDVLLCPGAMVVGWVKIGQGSSVWYNAVIRGDVHDVIIGRYASIQDGTLIHEDSGRGSGLEGGLRAIIMDGAIIGRGSVVGAGALVTKNTVVPPFSLVLGSPAKVVRTLPEASLAQRKEQAMHYYGLAQEHRRMLADLPE